MGPKRAFRCMVFAAGIALGGCTVQPSLPIAPTSERYGKRYDLDAALRLTESSGAIRRAAKVSSPCLTATAIEAPFAQNAGKVVADRLGQLFDKVEIIPAASGSNGQGVVFELDLAAVSYRHGCASSPETYVEVGGSLRMMDSQGREGWRSRTVVKRRNIEAMPTDPVIDDGFSKVIGALADELGAEFSALPSVTVASMVARPLTADIEGRSVRIAPGGGVGNSVPETSAAPSRFSSKRLPITFSRGEARPDDIAVIIGNADYSRQAKDVPDSRPAYADAESIKAYVTEALGIREGNVIFVRDGTYAQMTRIFGARGQPRGQLFDWVKPGRSRVFVYFSGHGSVTRDGMPYLVPADADGGRLELSAFPMSVLYDNLGALPAERVTLVIEACFSGLSPAGSMVGGASPVLVQAKSPEIPRKVTVVSAAMADQMANWEHDGSSSLFTKYFLTGMAGEADRAPYGNRDGAVTFTELKAYLSSTMSYEARRFYGRDQEAQVINGG